jgi:nitric oxide reductase NorD protein
MLDFLELEETVGRAWHRLVGGAVSYPRYPEHGVSLDQVRAPLAVFFRGLGGEFGVQLAGTSARSSSHRLSLRQRIGIAEERLEQPGRDTATLFLPPKIELFPSRHLNEALYSWLAAYFAIFRWSRSPSLIRFDAICSSWSGRTIQWQPCSPPVLG